MSGIKSKICFYLCILLSVICIGLFACEQTKSKENTVQAEETAVFQMEEGVSYRNCWSEEHCGLTYTATINKTYYNAFVTDNSVKKSSVKINLLIVPYEYINGLGSSTVARFATAKNYINNGQYAEGFAEAKAQGAEFWYGIVDDMTSGASIDKDTMLKGGLKTIQTENANRRYFGIYYIEGQKTDGTVVRQYASLSSPNKTANSLAYVVSSLSLNNRNDWEIQNMTTFLKRSVEGALKTSLTSEEISKIDLEKFNTKTVSDLVKAEIEDITYGDDIFGVKVYGALVESDGTSNFKEVTDTLDFNLNWNFNSSSGVSLISSDKKEIAVQDVKGTDYTKASFSISGQSSTVSFKVSPLTLTTANSTATVSDYKVTTLSEISSLGVTATVKVTPSGKRTTEKNYTLTPTISGSGLGQYTATVTGSGKFGGQISTPFNILGILSVSDITTYNDFYATAKPVFPTATDGITYSYDTSKLSVSGNKFTGKVNGTHTVTANIKNGVSTTFKVTVNDASGLDATNLSNTTFKNRINSDKASFNSFVCDKANLTMFIGDSFFDTAFFSDFYLRFADYNAYTFGISSSQARQWEWYVQKLYEINPKSIVIHIGTNDIFDDGKDADEVTARLKRLFTNIHENLPNTKVYWFSIEPRIGSGDASGNAIAVTVNNNIKSYLNGNGYATYMDSYSFFNSNQNDTYYRDTVHPTVYRGYNELMRILSESGHTFSANSNFNGKLSLGSWTTASTDEYDNAKMIYLARGSFLYTTTVTVNSSGVNSHISFNFNHTYENRFLLWDSSSSSSGKFYYTGAGSGNHISANINNYAIVGQKINVAVLKAEKHAYFFVDGVLQAVLLNAPAVTYLTVGSVDNCSVTLANNNVYSSSRAEYTKYLAKSNVSTYQSETSTAQELLVNCTAGINGAVHDDFETYSTNDTPNGTADSFITSRGINGVGGKFLFAFNFIIKSTESNGHITINFNNSGDTRFLIWDANSDSNFDFGGVGDGQTRSGSTNHAVIGVTYHVDIFVCDNHAYMFIDDTLQTIYANIKNVTITSLTLGTESCRVYFGAMTLYTSNESDPYSAKASAVSGYENNAYSGIVDVASYMPSSPIADWSTETTSVFGGSQDISGASGKFLLTFNTTITAEDTSKDVAPHLTFNFNNSGGTRFLLWDTSKSNKFYYCGAANSSYVNSSVNYATMGGNISVAILVADKNAYMFINGTLQTVYMNVPTVSSMSLGSELCAASFSHVKLYNNTSAYYTTLKNSVSTYENSAETASKIVDIWA